MYPPPEITTDYGSSSKSKKPSESMVCSAPLNLGAMLLLPYNKLKLHLGPGDIAYLWLSKCYRIDIIALRTRRRYR